MVTHIRSIWVYAELGHPNGEQAQLLQKHSAKWEGASLLPLPLLSFFLYNVHADEIEHASNAFHRAWNLLCIWILSMSTSCSSTNTWRVPVLMKACNSYVEAVLYKQGRETIWEEETIHSHILWG